MLLATLLTTAVLLLAAPVVGQETSDTTVYEGKDAPVWVMVKDAGSGVHDVFLSVLWSDEESKLPFARDVGKGDIVVLLPITEKLEDVDLSEACRFTSGHMTHGSTDIQPAHHEKTDCTAPRVALLPMIGMEHPVAPMACQPATRKDDVEEETVRYFGCYWAAPPES